jgi:hypothetical protein
VVPGVITGSVILSQVGNLVNRVNWSKSLISCK